VRCYAGHGEPNHGGAPVRFGTGQRLECGSPQARPVP
jgi:hypothetical protein